MASETNHERLAEFRENLAAEWRRRNGMPVEALADRTDDELRAECERRGLISGELAVADLVRASDAAMRGEYKRRFGYCPAEVERDFKSLLIERDEWRRRAEAAEERNLHAITTPATTQMTADEKRALIESGSAIIRDYSVEFSYLEALKGLKFEIPYVEDMSKGIASKPAPRPDNSVAFLDEDLLADDA